MNTAAWAGQRVRLHLRPSRAPSSAQTKTPRNLRTNAPHLPRGVPGTRPAWTTIPRSALPTGRVSGVTTVLNPAFDPVADEVQTLRVRPQVGMECSVIDICYLCFGLYALSSGN